MSRTLTAPTAIIKFAGIAIGRIRTVTINESMTRGTVRGIGQFNPVEVPALTWDGTLTCAMYNIDFKKAMNKLIDGKVIQRNVSTIEDFVNTVLLNEDGVQVDLMQKTKDSVDPQTGVITAKLEVFASIKKAFITREAMDVNEGQISGRNVDFTYITPILYDL